MHPRPSAETVRPSLPSFRCGLFIACFGLMVMGLGAAHRLSDANWFVDFMQEQTGLPRIGTRGARLLRYDLDTRTVVAGEEDIGPRDQ
jgi:hypothetical protein